MVNLLSPKTQSHLRATYYLRLATVAALALACACGIGVALLLPSYFLIHADADDSARYVSTLAAIASQHTKSQATETLAAFNEELHLLNSSQHAPAVARLLSLAVAPLPRSVSIDKIDLVLGSTGTIATTLTGSSGTRTDLIAYAEALKKVHEFKDVVLPVSNLVSEKGNQFAITFTYVPTP